MSRRCEQSIRERIGGEGSRVPVYAAASAVCVGAVCTGISLAWATNASEKLVAGKLNGLDLNKIDLYWNHGMLTMGCCVSTLPVAILLDTIGRKATMILATVPFYLGYVLILFAQHIYMMHAGRFMTGLGAGAFSCCCPLYASEIAHKEIRGRVVSFYFMFVSFGFIYAIILGWLLPIKLFIFACIIVPVIFTAMFFFQPRSPVHSVQKGKVNEAVVAIKALRGSKYDVTAEIKTIRLELSRDVESSHFFGVFKDRGVIRGTIISVALLTLKHLVGATLVLTFTSDIVGACGFARITAKWSFVAGGMIQVLASLVPLKYVDRVGRRFLLTVGFSITFTSSAVLGVYYAVTYRKLGAPKLIETFNWVPLIALAFYWFGYGAGLGSISAMTAVEIFPADVRAKCKCFTTFFNWLGSFLVTMIYLHLREAYGYDTGFFFYSFFSIIGILLTIFIYPEATMKESLEVFTEIKNRKHIFKISKKEPIYIAERQ